MALLATAMRARLIGGLGLAALAAAAASPTRAQLPLAVPKSSGQTVTPAFEGWYRNPAGTFSISFWSQHDAPFSISFGYYNRNASETVSVPIGAANRVEPGPPNQGQPTEFQPGRHSGAFAAKAEAVVDANTWRW